MIRLRCNRSASRRTDGSHDLHDSLMNLRGSPSLKLNQGCYSIVRSWFRQLLRPWRRPMRCLKPFNHWSNTSAEIHVLCSWASGAVCTNAESCIYLVGRPGARTRSRTLRQSSSIFSFIEKVATKRVYSSRSMQSSLKAHHLSHPCKPKASGPSIHNASQHQKSFSTEYYS